MSILNALFAELTFLTQNYLLQEHSLNDRIFADGETYAYFRDYVAAKKQAASSIPSTLISPSAQNPSERQNLSRAPQPPLKKPEVQIGPTRNEVKISGNVISESNKAILPPLMASTTPLESPRLEMSIDAKQPQGQKAASAKETGEKPFFTLEVPSPVEPANFSDLRKIFSEKFPGVLLIDHPPCDEEGKRVSVAWQSKSERALAAILTFDEVPKHQAFLRNLSKAIELCGIRVIFFQVSKIEQSKEWPTLLQSKNLNFVIASGYNLYSFPGLLRHYREIANESKHYLDNIPLLLLSDIAFYLKEPSLKSSLWKTLKEFLLPFSHDL